MEGIEPTSAFVAVGIFYAYVPYLIIFWTTLTFAFRRGTRELNVLVFAVLVFLVADLLKKHCAHPRPEESCLSTCGMPSTHSAFAVGFMMLRFFEIAVQMRPESTLDDVRGTSALPLSRFSPCRWVTYVSDSASSLEFAAWDEMTHAQQTFAAISWSFLLFPVPLSRMLTSDNSPLQVLVGMGLGACLATLWVAGMCSIQHHTNHRLGKVLLGSGDFVLLVHNMALPCHVAEGRCGPCDTDDDGDGGNFMSLAPKDEISWYMRQTLQRRSLLMSLGRLSPSESTYLDAREARLRHLLKNDRRSHVELALVTT